MPDSKIDLDSLTKPAAPIPLALGRFKQMPQRSAEVWQGMPVRLPAWVDNPDDPDGPPYRPWVVFWRSLRTGLIHFGMSEERGGWPADLALSSLFDFGAKWGRQLEGRPGRIEVSDARLRDAIAPVLATIGTPVELVDDLPAVREALEELETETSGGRRLPGALEGAGVTIDRLRAFAEAAAAFHRARPWLHLSDEDLIVVESPKPPRALSHVSVLGNAGQEFGLGFFESRRAFDRLIERGVPDRGVFGVTYGPVDELPFADADAWEDHALPVAGPRAYPMASRVTLDGVMTRPKVAELAFIEALFRTLGETTEDELDAGRWTRRVQTFDGPVDVTLALPSILEDEAAPEAVRSEPRPSRMFGEQVQQRVQRFLAQHEFGSPEEVNTALAKALREGLFDGDEDRATNRPPTDAERAQDLAYQAMDAVGRLRAKLARQALAISADCADAWIVLGDSAGDGETAIGQYERAMEAAARTLGPDRFTALAGEFWGHLDTRPYMRARLALAGALAAVGRTDEAVGHYQEMLRLNPGDNQGVRYLLLPWLLRLGRDAEAADLLAAYEDDAQATWPYGHALLAYRNEGDSALARHALADAVAANRHVVGFLIDPDQMPPGLPPHFALGSEEEAVFVAGELAAVVDAIPGARDWLARYGRVRSEARGRRKSRGRSRAKGRQRR